MENFEQFAKDLYYQKDETNTFFYPSPPEDMRSLDALNLPPYYRTKSPFFVLASLALTKFVGETLELQKIRERLEIIGCAVLKASVRTQITLGMIETKKLLEPSASIQIENAFIHCLKEQNLAIRCENFGLESFALEHPYFAKENTMLEGRLS